MKDNNYPNFEPSLGNLTHKIRKDFIEHSIQNNTLPNDSFENEDIISLVASNDETKPIYFWQLYSIAGEDNIHVLIKTFYEKIFSDYNSHWFRDAWLLRCWRIYFSENTFVSSILKFWLSFWMLRP